MYVLQYKSEGKMVKMQLCILLLFYSWILRMELGWGRDAGVELLSLCYLKLLHMLELDLFRESSDKQWILGVLVFLLIVLQF